jgi:hypothetical protein
LPYDVEKLLGRLVWKELKLAREQEILKQQLASRYDFSLDMLFRAIDDWNYKYVDQLNLKRFLIKCSVLPHDNLLVAIIRRMDLDADAKLNFKEFIDGVRPIENFTVHKITKPSVLESMQRPKTAKIQQKKKKVFKFKNRSPETMEQTLQQASDLKINSFEMEDRPRPRSQISTFAPENPNFMSVLVHDVFAKILKLERDLELQKWELANRRDFTLQAAFFLFANSPQHKLHLDEF